MKLAAIYNVWDSLELLPYSIASIRDHVDVVILVVQQYSNWGEKNNETWEVVGDLVDDKIIDYRIHMEPSTMRMSTPYAQKFETAKRQAGIDKAVELGCTHFIGMDADEMYIPEQFAKAKQLIDPAKSYAAHIQVYYKYPTLKLSELDTTYVPFICPLPARTGMIRTNLLIDPTRRTAKQYELISAEQLTMHHFSWVRKGGIETKLRNSTARKNIYKPALIKEWNEAKEGDTLYCIYPGAKLIKCDNGFSIPTNW